MKFADATQALSQGTRVRRTNWPKGNYYFLTEAGRKRYLNGYRAKNDRVDPAVFYWDDVQAVNWEITT